MVDLPEILYASSEPAQSRKLKQLINQGRIRIVIPRVYSSNMTDPLEVITRRNVWQIISRIFPGALISHRTALEFAPSPGKNIYLTASSRRVYKWPGISIRF